MRAVAHSVASGKREDRRENRSSESVRPHPYSSVACEVYCGKLQAMKKAAGLRRPLYPLRQREGPGNVLQNPLRKVEKLHILQGRTAMPLSLMLSTLADVIFCNSAYRYKHFCTCCKTLLQSNTLVADQSGDGTARCRLRTQGRTISGESCPIGASCRHSLPSAWWTLSSSSSAEIIATWDRALTALFYNRQKAIFLKCQRDTEHEVLMRVKGSRKLIKAELQDGRFLFEVSHLFMPVQVNVWACEGAHTRRGMTIATV